MRSSTAGAESDTASPIRPSDARQSSCRMPRMRRSMSSSSRALSSLNLIRSDPTSAELLDAIQVPCQLIVKQISCAPELLTPRSKTGECRSMGRPRSYVPEDVLSAAMRAFWRHGYAGASVDVLARATGLRRGSLYAAYPDKRTLFLAALGEYVRATVGHVERTLTTADDPLAGIAETLQRVARVAADGEGRHGCLLTNTATELGSRDPEIQAAVATAFARLETAYAGALERARAAGRLAAGVSTQALARLCVAVTQGLRVLGKSGAREPELRQVVDAALSAVGTRVP